VIKRYGLDYATRWLLRPIGDSFSSMRSSGSFKVHACRAGLQLWRIGDNDMGFSDRYNTNLFVEDQGNLLKLTPKRTEMMKSFSLSEAGARKRGCH
jgi:hypothetical protein